MSTVNVNGKYCVIDVDDPQPSAICDRTGFKVLHKDLVKQMEWQGDQLVWNGMLVHRDFALEPNPALKTPPVYNDPTPVRDPRPETDPELLVAPRPPLPPMMQLYELQNFIFNMQDPPSYLATPQTTAAQIQNLETKNA